MKAPIWRDEYGYIWFVDKMRLEKQEAYSLFRRISKDTPDMDMHLMLPKTGAYTCAVDCVKDALRIAKRQKWYRIR